MVSIPESTKDCTKEQKLSLRFFAELALKYNVKAGGINHKIKSTMLSNTKDNGPIFVGINVSHTASSLHGIASVVANIDSDLSKWPESIRSQQGRAKIVTELQDMMKERLTAFVGKEGKPSKIVVYRAGVSDNQYQKVLDVEFPKIKEARDSMYPGSDKPKITMLIVSSGHQNRFHAVGNQVVNTDHAKNGDRKDITNTATTPLFASLNPGAGTIIARTTKVNGAWEFFLQAHNVQSARIGPSNACSLNSLPNWRTNWTPRQNPPTTSSSRRKKRYVPPSA